MIPERANRTFICSVLFLDIVEYSKRPVAEQIQLKDQFNAVIADAIRDISPSDRIILDTGDGVAVNFLGDPEDALFVAMSLRESFAPAGTDKLQLPARIGINLGPVRLVRDLNGQPNVIGDGINVAQRVMGFGQPGQVLVSRSFYEVVSHISDDNSALFHYEGSRTDKHVREHEIYSVGQTSLRGGLLRSPAGRARDASRSDHRQSTTASVASGSFRWLRKTDVWLGNRTIAYGTAALSACAFVLAVLLNFLGQGEPQAKISQLPSRAQETPPLAAMDDRPIAGFPRVRETADLAKEVMPERRAVAPKPATQATKPTEANASSMQNSAEKKSRLSPFSIFAGRNENVESAAPVEPVGSGLITLAIAPWGEVFIDGNRIGVSPPVNEVEVAPGSRRVEIKNGSFQPYSQTVEIKADQKVRIKHKFN